MSPDTTLVQQLETALPASIAKRRWFRSKAMTISHVEVDHVIEADGFLILFLHVHYTQGGYDLYLLPITSVTSPNAEEAGEEPVATFQSPDDEPVTVYEAIFSPFFRTVLFRTLAGTGSFSGIAGSLVAQSTIAEPPSEGILESSVSRAEQSNTSIIYGKEYILKLFRKLEAGINPDIEMGAFLTSQGYPNTPAVLASLDYKTADGTSYSAGILQRFVPNQGDAWKYTLQSLGEYYHRALTAPAQTPDTLGDYAASAELLAARTAQMHVALSADTTNSNFVPELMNTSDSQALSEEIGLQAKTSLTLLREKLPTLAPPEQLLAHQVLNLEPSLLKRFAAIASITTSAKRIRYHGDYHLGQVLYTGTDFMIIDFEGEPARPLSERRAKALALRDVAGMVRSFQYAAYAGLYGMVPNLPDAPSEKLAELSAFWYSQVSKIYIESYFAEANAQPFLPSTPEQRDFFLDAFLLQKAFYEVQYELNNRPAWVGIPLRGILSLIAN